MCDGGGDPGGDPGAPGSIGSMGTSPGAPGQGPSDQGGPEESSYSSILAAIDPTVSVTPANQAMSMVTATETAAAVTAAANASDTTSGGSGSGTLAGSHADDTFSDETSTTPSHSLGAGGTVGDDTGHGGGMSADVDAETGELTGTTSYSAHASVTDAAVAAAQASLEAQAMAAGLATESGFGTVSNAAASAAAQAAVSATGQDAAVSLGNVTPYGDVTDRGHANIQAPIGTNTIATGQHSIASAWGSRSQAVQEGKSVSAHDMVSLQNQAIDPSTGQMTNVLNIPAPAINTPAFEQASRTSFIAGALNPDVAAAIGFASQAVMPGLMGAIAGSLQAAQAEEMGLPAPGLLGSLGTTGVAAIDDTMDTISSTLSSAEVAVGQGIFGAVEGVLGFASDALDDTLGQALSAVESGITDLGVSIGAFDAVDPADAAETAAATASFDDAGGSIGQAGGDPPALPTPAPTVTPTPEPRSTAPVVAVVDTFLDTSATTPLVSIPDIATPTLGTDEDLGVAPMMTTLPRRSSFRRSRVTSARDRAFGAANLFRPTLSAGISL